MATATAETAQASEMSPGATRRASLTTWALVVAIHLVCTVARIGLLAWRGGVVEDELLSWDALWYLHIAEHGYNTPRPGHFEDPMAFFPVLPGLIEVVHLVTGLGYRVSALVAGNLGGLAATLLVFALFRELCDRRTGLVAAFLFSIQPMAITLSMGYTEGVFVALAAGALLAVHREDWLLAGLLSMFAGLTRITGVAVALAVVVAAVLALWRRRANITEVVIACVLACAGAPSYVLWVGITKEDLGAYGDLQRAGWSNRWDWGDATWSFLREVLRDGGGWVQVSIAFTFVAIVVLALLAVWEGAWTPLVVYGLTIVALALGQSTPYHSKVRYLVPALLTLLPIADAIARARPPRAVVSLGLLALLGVWYSVFMLVGWDYAI